MFRHRKLLTPPNGHGEPPPPQPWQRQPTESSKAFQAFELYRAMGQERSLLKVGQQLVNSTQLLSRWSLPPRAPPYATRWPLNSNSYQYAPPRLYVLIYLLPLIVRAEVRRLRSSLPLAFQ